MTVMWTMMVVLSLICGAVTGNLSALSGAALEGASAAVELCLSLAGALCLWSGVMEVMRRCGLAGKLADVLRPVLGLLYPEFKRDRKVMDDVAANVSCNLLGLGSAATPMGVRAAQRMGAVCPGTATDAMCLLVVCNSASIQLLPTTVAAVRAANGCASPFDIIPAVWLTSAAALAAGIAAAKLLRRVWQ